MKHILNNLTEQEKNAIREQHTGGMKVSTDKFNQLMESKLGDVKPILSEQSKRVDVVKPMGQTIPLIQIKVAGKMCDLTMMRKLPTGASFYDDCSSCFYCSSSSSSDYSSVLSYSFSSYSLHLLLLSVFFFLIMISLLLRINHRCSI